MELRKISQRCCPAVASRQGRTHAPVQCAFWKGLAGSCSVHGARSQTSPGVAANRCWGRVESVSIRKPALACVGCLRLCHVGRTRRPRSVFSACLSWAKGAKCKDWIWWGRQRGGFNAKRKRLAVGGACCCCHLQLAARPASDPTGAQPLCTSQALELPSLLAQMCSAVQRSAALRSSSQLQAPTAPSRNSDEAPWQQSIRRVRAIRRRQA